MIKCHGTSNDFVLIDERAHDHLPDEQKSVIARLLCDRNGPVGADGILYMSDSAECDIKMRMFNPDGSEPETCANGLRCAARFLFETTAKESGSIETTAGRSSATRVLGGAWPNVYTVQVTVGPFFLDKKDFPSTDGAGFGWFEFKSLASLGECFAVSAPNPHLVSFGFGKDENALRKFGGIVEDGVVDLPNRANLSFVDEVAPREIFVQTFERGAGITASCGSAMASSAFAKFLKSQEVGDTIDKLKVHTNGGSISAEIIGGKDGQYEVMISGNATYVYLADVDIDFDKGKLSDAVRGRVYVDEIAAFSEILDAAKSRV